VKWNTSERLNAKNTDSGRAKEKSAGERCKKNSLMGEIRLFLTIFTDEEGVRYWPTEQLPYREGGGKERIR